MKKGKITKQIVQNKKVKNGKNNTKASKNKEAIVLFFILFLLILLAIIIWNSRLQLKIYNLDFSTDRKERVLKSFKIYLGIVIFKKIEILKINLKKIKNKKMNLGTVLEKAKKLEGKNNKQEMTIELIKGLKDFDFEIVKADLKVEIGLQDAALTAISVGIIASILGIILKKQKFEILPIYQDKNILNIKLNGIFRVNLIHYIYKTILKGRDKNERKSSDRRAYAYSNE